MKYAPTAAEELSYQDGGGQITTSIKQLASTVTSGSTVSPASSGSQKEQLKMFENLSDHDKNYLSASLIYGSIEDREYTYDYYTPQSAYNRVLYESRAVQYHLLDMIELRLEGKIPPWTYTCKKEEAQEVYDWIQNCSDTDFTEIVTELIRARDHFSVMDDRSLLNKLVDLFKGLKWHL